MFSQCEGFVAEKYIDSWYAICAERRHPYGVIGKINNPRYIAVCRNGKRLIQPSLIRWVGRLEVFPNEWKLFARWLRRDGNCTLLRRGNTSKSIHPGSGSRLISPEETFAMNNRRYKRRINIRQSRDTRCDALSETSFPVYASTAVWLIVNADLSRSDVRLMYYWHHPFSSVLFSIVINNHW